jgi:hypothetical protein
VHPTDTSRAPTSAGTAVGTSVTPVGNIVATNVQAALAELDSEINTFQSGQVLQTRFFTDAGSNLPATITNVTASNKDFTPKSTNSTIKVSVNFYGVSAPSGSFINAQIVQVAPTTGNVGAQLSSGLDTAGIAQSAGMCVIEGLAANAALTPRAFQLWANNATGAGGFINSMVWTITEVQN